MCSYHFLYESSFPVTHVDFLHPGHIFRQMNVPCRPKNVVFGHGRKLQSFEEVTPKRTVRTKGLNEE